MTHTDIHRAVRAAAAAQGGVILRRQAWNCGVRDTQIRWLVKRGLWRQLEYGVLLIDAEPYPAGTQPPLLASLWAAHLRCGPRSVIGLGSAARVHGLEGLPQLLTHVDVLLPHAARPRPGRRLRVHTAELHAADVVHLGRLPVTAPPRTLADVLLHLPEPEALSLLDSALHRGLLAHHELPSVERALSARPGATRARTLLPLADARAESPLHTRVRLDCLRGGVPPDHLQYRVHDPLTGRHLSTAAFCWSQGLRHPLLAETEADLRPPPRPRGPFTLLRFTWQDALHPGRCASLVREALAKLSTEQR